MLPGMGDHDQRADHDSEADELGNDAARSAPKGVVMANFLSYVYGAIGIALIMFAIQNVDQVMASDTPVKSA